MGTLTHQRRRNIIGVLGWLRTMIELVKGTNCFLRRLDVTSRLVRTCGQSELRGVEGQFQIIGLMYRT